MVNETIQQTTWLRRPRSVRWKVAASAVLFGGLAAMGLALMTLAFLKSADLGQISASSSSLGGTLGAVGLYVIWTRPWLNR